MLRTADHHALAFSQRCGDDAETQRIVKQRFALLHNYSHPAYGRSRPGLSDRGDPQAIQARRGVIPVNFIKAIRTSAIQALAYRDLMRGNRHDR